MKKEKEKEKKEKKKRTNPNLLGMEKTIVFHNLCKAY
jgi:hypothetical protein